MLINSKWKGPEWWSKYRPKPVALIKTENVTVVFTVYIWYYCTYNTTGWPLFPKKKKNNKNLHKWLTGFSVSVFSPLTSNNRRFTVCYYQGNSVGSCYFVAQLLHHYLEMKKALQKNYMYGALCIMCSICTRWKCDANMVCTRLSK